MHLPQHDANHMFLKLGVEIILLCVICTDCVDENDGAAGLILQCLNACNHDVRLKVSKHIICIGEGAVVSG